MSITLRYTFRSLSRSKGFVAIAITALGIGLGLSTTMFAVVDTIRNPALSYRDPASLVQVSWRTGPRSSIDTDELARLITAQSRSVGDVTLIHRLSLRVAQQVNVNRANGLAIDADYFRVSGTRLRAGRPFTAEDGDEVAIVSDQMWRWTFGDRRELAGATLTLDDQPRAIVGIVRQGRSAPEAVDVWIPARAGTPASATRPMVRLRNGMTYLQSLGEFGAIGAQINRQFGHRDAPISAWSMPIAPQLNVEQIREPHVAMIASALIVLIVACVNLANLMLARGISRRRELALRMALGASRRMVVAQLFSECAVITAGGVVLGALFAVWGQYVLNYRMPGEVPLIGTLHVILSWRTFAFCAIAAALAALVFGLVPAIRVVRNLNLDEPLKDGAGTTGRTVGRYSGLVMVEVALALVLMMASGLLLRTVHAITSVAYTFDARTLLEGSVYRRVNPTDTARARRGFDGLDQRDALLASIRTVPGVRAAAFSRSRMPIGGVLTGEMIGGDSTRTINTLFFEEVSWQYLRVFGLTINAGRDFEAGDESGQGVAILNAVAAQRLYPNREAVGHMIKLGAPSRNAPWISIVGIARSPMALRSGEEPVGPMIWVTGPDTTIRDGTVFVRASSEGGAIRTRLRSHIRTTRPFEVGLFTPYTERRDAEVRARTFLANAFVTMGTVSLFLAAVGLYGMLSHAVGQRMREFAVRIALGAQRPQLFRIVMHDAAIVILAGTGIGAFAALATTRMIDNMLTNVLPSDVVTLVMCELILILAGFAAAYGPARQALKANPLDILRAV